MGSYTAASAPYTAANGVVPVVALGVALIANSAKGSRETQSPP